MNWSNNLGLAYKARLLVYGEAIIDAIRKKKAHLVIIANDASDNSKKKIIDKCTFYEVNYIVYSDKKVISQAISKNVIAVAILDAKLAKKMKQILEES